MKALALNEADPQAHVVLAIENQWYEWDSADAEREFKRAIELAPDEGDAYGYYSWFIPSMGRNAEAIDQAQRMLPGFGIGADYALCDTDATNLVHVSGTYDLPFGRGRQFLGGANRATDAALGGWNVNFIYTCQGGQPFTINCATATSEFGCFANVVPGQNIYSSQRSYKQWLNPSAFAEPPMATAIGQTNYAVLGGVGQQARGPAFNNLDSSVFKNFALTETFRLQFRAEAFNTTNTPQFGNPSPTLGTSSFGQITATRFPSQSSRRLQLALKLFF